ncbi:MAG: hypothetical protein ACD_2C00200G0006 [uncultured bacterium (gcode 4)]|uniref:Lipoprotein n=1 Tax=uncultured bacterium (gcode 4) TaxID=1234023 RepID=K2H0E9_9BACT|nr:MAG: hypothetical protein ACD_2C00200G0006 [uncultured bacterium (gcode 4)]
MKKLLLLTPLLLILASCGGWTTSDTATKAFTSTWFTMNIPSAWVEVEQKTLPATKNGKIVLALTSSEINAWFANNLVVLSEDLSEITTSVKYSITNYVRTTWTVQEFIKLNEEDFKFPDEDEWKLYTFEAKYSTQTPKRKFLQTAKVCDHKAYLITIWINTDNANVAKYSRLLQSFNCTK